MKIKKKWLGIVPSMCDICQNKIADEFFDAKTDAGPWANMCPECFIKFGVGLGTGLGQRYIKANDNEFIKIGG